jgi:hypothetical protein
MGWPTSYIAGDGTDLRGFGAFMLENPWLRIGFGAWSLSIEAAYVMVLRTLKIAGGGYAAGDEAERMINEKIEAGLALQSLAMTGRLGATPQSAASKTLTHYRRKVRANRRRLISRK